MIFLHLQLTKMTVPTSLKPQLLQAVSRTVSLVVPPPPSTHAIPAQAAATGAYELQVGGQTPISIHSVFPRIQF